MIDKRFERIQENLEYARIDLQITEGCDGWDPQRCPVSCRWFRICEPVTLSQLLEEVESRAPEGRVDHEFTRKPDGSWLYTHTRTNDTPYPELFMGEGSTKEAAVCRALEEMGGEGRDRRDGGILALMRG